MPPKTAAKKDDKADKKPSKSEDKKPDAKKANDKNDDAEKTKLLNESGLLEAYEYVVKSLYKAGMPEGNIFEFTSSRILKFEHKWNTEQKKKGIIQKYKNIGAEEAKIKAQLEKSIAAKSERSQSAKTTKSKKEEPAKGAAKGKEPSKSKEPAKKKK